MTETQLAARRASARRYQAQRYARLKSAGLCTKCELEPIAGSADKCRDCARASAEVNTQRRERRKVRCAGCGGKRTKSAKRCLSCTARARNLLNNPKRRKPRPACACGKVLSLKATTGRCQSCNARKQAAIVNGRSIF